MTKPKCLLVAPTKYFYIGYEFPVKYHLVSLFTHLLDIAEVKVIDLEIRFGYISEDKAVEPFLAKARRLFQMQEFRPDVIGISCYSTFDYLCSLDLLRLFDALYPEAVKIVGGHHPTALPADFSEVPVDYIVRGEGEIALRQIIADGRRGDHVVVNGTALSADQMKILRFDLYPYRSENVFLASSRGCPYKCAFCVQSDDFANHYRRISYEQVKENLQLVVSSMPVHRILFIDSFFGYDRSTTERLLELLKSEYADLEYVADIRVDSYKMDWILQTADLRFMLYCGVESLAEDTIELMKKSRNPERYIDSFFDAVEICQSEKLLMEFGFILNHPGELLESYRQTLSRIKKAVARYDRINFAYRFNPFSLYPGNDLYQQRHRIARQRGFVFSNDGWWRIRTADIYKRSQDCLASRQLAEAYGNDPVFWSGEIEQIRYSLLKKFSHKAYSYFKLEDITSSLKQHYNRKANIFSDSMKEVTNVIATYRYLLNELRCEYRDWFATRYPQAYPAFLSAFEQQALDHQERLLQMYDKGTSPSVLLKAVQELSGELHTELQANTSDVNGGALELEIFAKRYRYVEQNGQARLQLSDAL